MQEIQYVIGIDDQSRNSLTYLWIGKSKYISFFIDVFSLIS